MTNNPDSKAPERIWATYNDALGFPMWEGGSITVYEQPTRGRYSEYTRTDAITPQQAAKVLVENNVLHDLVAIMDMHCQGWLMADALIYGLKALADSEDLPLTTRHDNAKVVATNRRMR